MTNELAGQRVLVIGGARNLGAAIAHGAAGAGAEVVIGARVQERARVVAAELPGASALRVDITDEASVQAAGEQLGHLDHVVVTAAAHHNVAVTELQRDRVLAAFEAKVIGPMLLAKHLAPLMTPTGSLLLFSGILAWTPTPGRVVTGVANGAVSFLVSHLARELAPIRVNAISPGIIDSGAWDGLDATSRELLFAGASAGNLAGRVGTPQDIVDTALWLLGNGFVTGETIHVSGGTEHR